MAIRARPGLGHFRPVATLSVSALLALIVNFSIIGEATAAEAPESGGASNLDEVGEKLANPLADLWALNFNSFAPGFFDGDVLIYQGTVLVDMNSQQMVSALNIPQAKLAKRELDSAAQRVVTLKELLGDGLPDIETIRAALIKGFTEGLGIEAAAGEITENEEALANRYFIEEIGTDEFVAEIDNPGDDNETLAGSHTGPGGTIDAFVKLDGPTKRILQRVLISGDFFVTPPRTVFDLEAHLAGARLEEVDDEIDAFFASNDIDMLSVAPGDFKTAIANALGSGGIHV